MKRYFSVNFPHLAASLLPHMFRIPFMRAFALAVALPVEYLYNLFADKRQATLYRLGITGQICYMEKALNDHFDMYDRRIYITDGDSRKQSYIYTREEAYPQYIHTNQDFKPQYIYQRGELAAGEISNFIVNIPAGLDFNIIQMRALIDMYKLAGKSYIIVQI